MRKTIKKIIVTTNVMVGQVNPETLSVENVKNLVFIGNLSEKQLNKEIPSNHIIISSSVNSKEYQADVEDFLQIATPVKVI